MARMLRTITVGKLKDLLDGEDDGKRVIFSTNYGDYHNTMQALPLEGELEEVLVEPSAYSNSGFAVSDEEADEADGEGFLLIK